MRTKMLTSGSLSGAQEFLASWIAKDRNKDGHYFTSRVPKMAAYGAFISAPMGHILISILQKIFAGRTSLKAKILQILVSNLVVSTQFNWWKAIADMECRLLLSRTPCTCVQWLLLPEQEPSTKSMRPGKRVLCPSWRSAGSRPHLLLRLHRSSYQRTHGFRSLTSSHSPLEHISMPQPRRSASQLSARDTTMRTEEAGMIILEVSSLESSRFRSLTWIPFCADNQLAETNSGACTVSKRDY